MIFRVKLPEKDIDKILSILADRPYKEVAQLIPFIIQQTTENRLALDVGQEL